MVWETKHLCRQWPVCLHKCGAFHQRVNNNTASSSVTRLRSKTVLGGLGEKLAWEDTSRSETLWREQGVWTGLEWENRLGQVEIVSLSRLTGNSACSLGCSWNHGDSPVSTSWDCSHVPPDLAPRHHLLSLPACHCTVCQSSFSGCSIHSDTQDFASLLANGR